MKEHSHSVFFDIFPWDKNFETGIEQIDKQHQRLVKILNRLAAHLANRSHDVILDQIFDELAEYADYHFKTEEEIWGEYFKGDESYIEHEKIHKSFITQVIALKKEELNKPLDEVIQDIVSFLSKWLAYHILDSDKRLAKVVLAMEAGHELEQAKQIADEQMSGSMQVLINTVLKMYDSLSTRTLDLMREKVLRIKAEEALTLSEERWKFILGGNAEGVWDWDVKNDQANDRTRGGWAWSKENTTIHPLDVNRVETELRDHLEGKTDFYINKYRVLQESGGWSWVLTRGKVVSRDDNGNALRMVGTHSDITKTELASMIYQHSSQAMFIADVNKEVISVNPAYTQVTGYTEQDILGKKTQFLTSDKYDDQFYNNMWDTINSSGHWTGEIWNKRKNGEVFPEILCINTVLDHNGLVDHYLALFTDITESKKEVLRTDLLEKLLLQTLSIESADDLLCKTLDLLVSNELLGINSQGAVYKASETKTTLTLQYGLNLSESLKNRCATILLDSCFCGKGAQTVQLDHSTGDKQRATGSNISINLIDTNRHRHFSIPVELNDTVSYVIILELNKQESLDVENSRFFNAIVEILGNTLKRLDTEEQLLTAKSRLEERVKQRTSELAIAVEEANKANLSKSEFIAHISHELRTPMHGILSFASFGIKKTETVTRDKLKHYFSNIEISGKRLLTLLNDLLDLSKLEAGKMELDMSEADLRSVFEACKLEQSQRMLDLSLTIEVAQPSGPVIGIFDAARIGQVITNLLSNAIKFSPEGGVIKVAMERNTEKGVLFSLQDNGVGVPEGEEDAIFDSFTQSSHATSVKKGTGLGLAISKKIIEGHRGKIWVENNVNENGAIFKFVLPL